MKTKGRRQSKNVEIRGPEKINNLVTPEMWMTDNEPFVKRREQEMKGKDSQHLRDKTRIKDQKKTRADEILGEIHASYPGINRGNKTREETAKPTKFVKKPKTED